MRQIWGFVKGEDWTLAAADDEERENAVDFGAGSKGCVKRGVAAGVTCLWRW